MKLDKKVAVITGGSRGIGYAIADKFLKEGAVVIITASTPETAAKAVAKLREANPGTLVDGISPRLDDAADVRDAFQWVSEVYGSVDILVNNAALWRDRASLAESSSELWKKYLDVNIMGVYYCTKAVICGMIENGYGRIINVASVAGVYGNAKMSHYSTTKGAVISMTKALAKEVDGNAKFHANIPL